MSYLFVNDSLANAKAPVGSIQPDDAKDFSASAAGVSDVTKNVQTFGIIEKKSKRMATDKNFYIDESEGLGAFLTIILLGKEKVGPLNVDIGGGNLDYNSGILKQFFNIDNFVFDPYSKRKGQEGLEEKDLFEQRGFIIEEIKGAADTATSFSILNVLVKEEAGNYIFDRDAAKSHLKLALSCLQKNGVLYIKVYEGNESNVITPGYSDSDGYHFAQTNFLFDNPEYISLIEEICGDGSFWKFVETNHKYKYYIIQKTGGKVFGGKKTKKVKKNLKNKSKNLKNKSKNLKNKSKNLKNKSKKSKK